MKEKIIISDFDGTITKKDTLYHFFKTYAKEEWKIIEELWTKRKIGSLECLEREFELVKNLSEELIDEFIKTLEIDDYFFEFIKKTEENNVDFVIVSDGIDYFINKVLDNNKLYNINIISNHGEFKKNNFNIACPNGYNGCIVNSGTCKCKVINEFKNKYKEVIYIGDGTSDFCIAENVKVQKLFAKTKLQEYCIKKNIDHIKYNTFKDIITYSF